MPTNTPRQAHRLVSTNMPREMPFEMLAKHLYAHLRTTPHTRRAQHAHPRGSSSGLSKMQHVEPRRGGGRRTRGEVGVARWRGAQGGCRTGRLARFEGCKMRRVGEHSDVRVESCGPVALADLPGAYVGGVHHPIPNTTAPVIAQRGARGFFFAQSIVNIATVFRVEGRPGLGNSQKSA